MTSADINAGSGTPEPENGTPLPSDDELVRLLTDWVPAQRWFAAKGRTLGPFEVISRVPLATVRGDARIEHLLLSVAVGSGETSTVQRYQMFLGWHPWLPGLLDHARIGSVGNWTAYDALHDAEVTAVLLRYLTEGREVSGLIFEPETAATSGAAGTAIDPTAHGMVIGAEQSNTSIVYGSSAILKVFRRLEPGPNPDAEVHRALWQAGCRNIAAPLGLISARLAALGDVETTLALMTTFYSGSAEGWAMATASVRDLMAEADLRADEVGGDFAAESYRLGKAVAHIHADLATALGTAEVSGDDLATMMSDMAARAAATARDVPALEAHQAAIQRAFDTAEASGSVPVQRIHGDLHLGQTLRTLQGWAIIDFEGEPAKPLAYRRSLQSPLKDVAGMLRSFDYAAHHSLVGGQANAQHLYRATEWAERNRSAFCDGYASVAGSDPRDSAALLAAFELDKAVYEVGYEHGHRPTWEPIPLLAVSRLTRTGGRS